MAPSKEQEVETTAAAAPADEFQSKAPGTAASSTARADISSPLKRFWRGTLLQCIITGLVSFCNPGIWNALNSLGAGGQQKPYLVNAANAITFGIMIFGCTLAGGLSNKIGLKWTVMKLVLGTVGYPFYSASLYTNNRYGTEWFVLVGAVTCGLSASCLWASEAAIVLGYPEHRKRGRYVAIWLAIRNVGQLIGGAVNFGLNVRYATTGKVGSATYLVLIALQCCGLPLALALSPPHKVVRDDGTRVVILKQTNWRAEAKAIWRLVRAKRVLLLIPVFIFGQWSTPYESNYLAAYFTVRSRALGSFLTACSGITGNLVTGHLLDHLPFSRRDRARIVWCWLAFLFTGLFIWQTTNQVTYDRTTPSLDWSLPGFGRGFASHIIWQYAIESLQTYLYWTMGTLNDGVGTLARTTGLLRSFESVGSTFAYTTSATKWRYLYTLIFAFAAWVFSMPFTTYAAWLVPDQASNMEVEGAVEESDSEYVGPVDSGSNVESSPKEKGPATLSA
ncbi:hypothetical protein SLS55_000728 [Diplodia seriata]|uniref:Duf895 domain membrane protein n=1 Tax=Diplodia seriata TaxID=420778 RepID=A0ABR3CV52_9PEZI